MHSDRRPPIAGFANLSTGCDRPRYPHASVLVARGLHRARDAPGMAFGHFPDHVRRQPQTRYDASSLGFERAAFEDASKASPFRGVHHWQGIDPDLARNRIAAAAKLLPEGAAIGGWAAAQLLGARDLDGIEISRDRLIPVPICLQPDMQLRERAGIVLWRSEFGSDEIDRGGEIPILSPVRTCFDVARHSADLADAVAGIDAMLRAGLVKIEELAAYSAQHRRWRGGPRLRRAMSLADRRARSCAESRLRVLWVVDAGLPHPEINVPLHDVAGRLLGIPDLFDANAGLAGEYDGAMHRRIEQHTADNSREEMFEAHGVIVVRVTGLDLSRHRRRTIERIRIAHARGLARDRSRDAWTIRAERAA